MNYTGDKSLFISEERKLMFTQNLHIHHCLKQGRRQVFKSGGDGFQLVGENARERSDQARGSEATERGQGVGGGFPPSHGREIFQFWGSESCILVHAVMRFFTLYLIRIWIQRLDKIEGIKRYKKTRRFKQDCNSVYVLTLI